MIAFSAGGCGGMGVVFCTKLRGGDANGKVTRLFWFFRPRPATPKPLPHSQYHKKVDKSKPQSPRFPRPQTQIPQPTISEPKISALPPRT